MTGQASLALARPALRDGYRVSPISDRGQVLREGLEAEWAIRARLDTHHRRQSDEATDSFTVHLLTRHEQHWAVVCVLNKHWARRTGRHHLLTSTLSAAPVAATLTGLAQAVMGADAFAHIAPTPGYPGALGREQVRLDVVNLILDQPDVDRDALTLLLGLTDWAAPLQARRETLALEEAISEATDRARLVLCLTRRPNSNPHEARLLFGIETCVRLHWDAVAGQVTTAYAPAEEVVYRTHFGEEFDTIKRTYPTCFLS